VSALGRSLLILLGVWLTVAGAVGYARIKLSDRREIDRLAASDRRRQRRAG
jgi:hypothetical protein